jgi:hypothetical protein
MRNLLRLCCSAFLSASPLAGAQAVVESDRHVATDTPEAWAMRYFAGTTLMTSLGETAVLRPWRWSVAADLGNIPGLSDAQRRVGFGGVKDEDLNKSPVFGRLRLALGLPDGWLAELGYTPPLEIDGARPRNVVALALGRRVLETDAITLSLRAVGQVGRVTGDITCPADVVTATDPSGNPFGCRAPSNDTFTTNHCGVDSTLGWGAGNWRLHAGAGIVRTRLAVQVDALVDSINDRSRLTSNGLLAWFTAGARYAIDARWSVAGELLYVPLDVRRPPDNRRESDPLAGVRLQVRYVAD